MAIAVDNLADAEEMTEAEKEEEEARQQKAGTSRQGSLASSSSRKSQKGSLGHEDHVHINEDEVHVQIIENDPADEHGGEDNDRENLIEEETNQASGTGEIASGHRYPLRPAPSPVSTRLRIDMINEERNYRRDPDDQETNDYEDDENTQDEVVEEEDADAHATARPRRLSEINIAEETRPIPPYSSFFIFATDNKFRLFCHKVCNHRYFGNVVLVCILVSSFMLAMEDPVVKPEESEWNKVSSRLVQQSHYNVSNTTVREEGDSHEYGLW